MKFKPHSFFTLAVILIMAYALWEARSWPLRASIMILVLGSAGILMAFIQLYTEFRASGKIQTSGMDIELDESQTGKKATPRILTFGGWVVALFLAIWLLGFTVSIPLFSLLYAKLNGARWYIALIIAAINLLFLQGLYEQLLHVPWPDPVLQRFIPFLPS